MDDSTSVPASDRGSERPDQEEPGHERATGKGGRPSRLERLEPWGMGLLLVAVIVFFSFLPETSETFPTSANVRVVVANQSVLAIVALAALIPLVCNEWDLSVGAVAGVSAVYAASVLSSGGSIPVAILVGVAIGVCVGAFNALIVTRVGVNAVITTLGTATILGGVITAKTEGTAIVGNIPTAVSDFGAGTTIGIPSTTVVMAVIAGLTYYMLNYTPFGRYLYALGSNREAAQLVGLRNRLVLASAFVAAGALSGAAGVLQVARAGGADPKVGATFTLPALAAAFLSAAAVRPGKYNVGGLLTAIFFLAFLNSGLNLAGAQSYVSDYVNGAALILGVALAAYLGRKRRQA